MGNFPMRPIPASEHAASYDLLFFTIVALTVFFTVVVVAMIAFLGTRYRRGSKASRKNPLPDHLGLELSWTIVPLLLGVGIFVWGTIGFMKQREMPEDGLEIYVIGKRWMWHLEHMNGIREMNELHIPVNTPIKFTMISQDVLHSMYLPEFRAQYHVVPGRYTDIYFTATKTGTFKMLCAMYCGTQHSEMVGQIHVLSEEDYGRWLEKNGNRYMPDVESMAAAGELLYKKKGCGNCHTAQDNERGPTLMGLMGSVRTMADGSTLIADEDYVRESILNPYDRLTYGYENTMPAYTGQLTEEQVIRLFEYIKSLGEVGGELDSFEREGAGAPSADGDATRIANERKSAGAAQFRQTEGN